MTYCDPAERASYVDFPHHLSDHGDSVVMAAAEAGMAALAVLLEEELRLPERVAHVDGGDGDVRDGTRRSEYRQAGVPGLAVS